MQYNRAMDKVRMDQLTDVVSMELSDGRVAGARYLTVWPKFSNECTDFNFYHQTWQSMELWCAEQFGLTPVDGVWTPNARWYVNNRKFWFRNEADLSWFLLRWS